MKEHHLNPDPTHSVWDRSLLARLHIDPGDEVQIACVDASGGQVQPGMTEEEYLRIDRTRIHALTGPIWINGAAPGDVLEIDVLAPQHSGWGWSSIVEGLGFLKERFRTPYLFHWQLSGDTSCSLYPATVPLRPFLGVMGVARAEDGAFRTRPPGPSAAISTFANYVPDRGSTSRSIIPVRFSVAAMAMPPKGTVRSASTGSSVRLTSRCGFICTGNNRSPDRLSKPVMWPRQTAARIPGWW